MGEMGLRIAGSLGWAMLITTATWFTRAVIIRDEMSGRDTVFTFTIAFLATELFRTVFL